MHYRMPLIRSLFSHWNVGSLWQTWRTTTRKGALVTTKSIKFMLQDIDTKYEERADSPEFVRLYKGSRWEHMFAVLHEELNQHFDAINGRAETTGHYWADNSRAMLDLLKDLKNDLYTLKRAGVDITLHAAYQNAIERCRPWLSYSGGSAVPEGFEPIEIIKYEPVFTENALVELKKQQEPIEPKMIGKGSYAHVYSYVDPNYGIKFAIKRANRDAEERDLLRFRKEFDVMKNLSFPYILEVYKYDASRNEYRMEHCDATLRQYISQRNNNLHFSTRKRIALQFLYGMSYIHSQKLLHRDISLQNVLMKVYESGAVLVKLSDFGLVKEHESTFTRAHTEMRGTILDPTLDNFRDYSVLNEIYAIGHVLSFIFTGRQSIAAADNDVHRIVQKCVAHNLSERYPSVSELIADVENLDVPAHSISGSGDEA